MLLHNTTLANTASCTHFQDHKEISGPAGYDAMCTVIASATWQRPHKPISSYLCKGQCTDAGYRE